MATYVGDNIYAWTNDGLSDIVLYAWTTISSEYIPRTFYTTTETPNVNSELYDDQYNRILISDITNGTAVGDSINFANSTQIDIMMSNQIVNSWDRENISDITIPNPLVTLYTSSEELIDGMVLYNNEGNNTGYVVTNITENGFDIGTSM